MAQGALYAAGADIALAVSGIAGPDGGSEEKPVGTVWFGFAGKDGRIVAANSSFLAIATLFVARPLFFRYKPLVGRISQN